MGQEESRILESLDLAVKSDAIRAKINAIVAGSVTLQRHLIALLKFAPVELRFCSCKRRGKATFDTPINPCARSACSRSVAVDPM